MNTNQQTVRQGCLVKALKVGVITSTIIIITPPSLLFIPSRILELAIDSIFGTMQFEVFLFMVFLEAILSASLLFTIPITSKITKNRRWLFLIIPPIIILALMLINFQKFFIPL